MKNSSNNLIVSVLQPKLILNEFEYNLEQYKILLEKFSKNINLSRVICFPEYWNGLRKEKYSFNINEKGLEFLSSIAKHHSVWVIGGSQVTKEKEHFRNRCNIFSPSGDLIGSYDKKNPFGYEQFQGIEAGKKDFFFDLDGWKATVRICSDLWNTQNHSELIQKGIDIIFAPTLTSLPNKSYTNYGRFLWHNLAVIRSKEAASAVVVSDPAMQIIKEPYWCAGASCIADPSWRFENQDPLGMNILSSIQDGSEGIVTVTLNQEKLTEQKSYRKHIGLMR